MNATNRIGVVKQKEIADMSKQAEQRSEPGGVKAELAVPDGDTTAMNPCRRKRKSCRHNASDNAVLTAAETQELLRVGAEAWGMLGDRQRACVRQLTAGDRNVQDRVLAALESVKADPGEPPSGSLGIEEAVARLRPLVCCEMTPRLGWTIGRILKAVKRSYTSGYMQKLAAALGYSDRLLYAALETYQGFPDPEVLRHGPDWSSIRDLCRIRDPELRHAMLEQTRNEHLTVRELRRRIRALRCQGCRRSASPRRVAGAAERREV
jgi:hypothetical protein